jgi:hypothetical protein
MFLDMLEANNKAFTDAVGPMKMSDRLDRVIDALTKAQAPAQDQVSQNNLRALLDALHDWRTGEPTEYDERGRKDGVAYRLWMEAKQLLKNAFHQVPYPDDPPEPPGCPGSTVLGVYVPLVIRETSEICHGFAYCWLVAAGKLPLTAPVKGKALGYENALHILYLGGVGDFQPARVDGVEQFAAGDLIGMFEGQTLVHSLIALSRTQMFSANNTGTFGVAQGRRLIDFTQGFRTKPFPVGWVGQGNKFKTANGIDVDVIYRRL